MAHHPAVTLIGVPTDIGAGARGASMGPEALRVAGGLSISGLPVLAFTGRGSDSSV